MNVTNQTGANTAKNLCSLLALVLWIALPLAVLSMSLSHTLNSELQTSRPAYVPLERSSSALLRPVELGLIWGEDGVLVAPDWSGVVQQILCASGSTLHSGSEVARVGGITRIAYQSTEPFSAPVSHQEEGVEVLRLQQLLNSLDFDVEESSYFGSETLAALRAFAAEIGVPEADEVLTFSPDWVIFLPRTAKASELMLTVGAPAPAAGTEIAKLSPVLIDAFVAELGTVTTEELDRHNPESAEDLRTLWTRVEDTEELLVDGEPLLLDESRSKVDKESLRTLTEILHSDNNRTNASISLKTQSDQWILPSPAVVIDDSGRACIYIQGSGHDERRDVTIIAVFDGKTIVSGGQLKLGFLARVSPPEEAASCAL